MADKPNISLSGDDIGISNLSCYSDGVMGYRTPNIDRIADEGMHCSTSARIRTSGGTSPRTRTGIGCSTTRIWCWPGRL